MYNFIGERECFPLYCLILGTIAPVQRSNIDKRTSNFLAIVERSTTRSVNGTRSFSLSLFLYISLSLFSLWSNLDSRPRSPNDFTVTASDNGERGRCISCFVYTRCTHKENTITLPRNESIPNCNSRWKNNIKIFVHHVDLILSGKKSLRGWNRILQFHHVFWINAISFANIFYNNILCVLKR